MRLDFILKYAFPLGATAAILISWALLMIFNHLSFNRNKPAVSETEDAVANRAIEHARMKARIALGTVLSTPIIICGGCVLLLVSDGVFADFEAMVLFGASGTILWGIAIIRWRVSIRRFKETGWHYAARKIVAEAVAPLTGRGHVIFHDFATDDLAIDHLIVGPKGVFALQTLVRPTSVKPHQLIDTTVTYDGRTLFFPGGKEHLSVDEATACAEKLSQWLSEHLDAPIAARAIIALPGWQVKRISAEGISVINPTQMEALFQYMKARPLAESTISEIKKLIEDHVIIMQSSSVDAPSDQEIACGS